MGEDRLPTTSYALLGILRLRPHTAYDLTQQASRSLAFVWQTSESQLYLEPRRLVRLGLVAVREEPAGPRRKRKVYEITDAGRTALREWLATPPSPPRLEHEVLLRVLLADSAGVGELRATIAGYRQTVEAQYEAGAALIRQQLEGAAPYSERASLNVLWWLYRAEQFRVTLAWLDFVEQEISTWRSTRPRPFDDRMRLLAQAMVDRHPVLDGDVNSGD
jgi:PadR family transcriptional regulator, regulatory protein AphA